MPSSASVANAIRRKGRMVTVRRVVANGTDIDAVAYAMVRGGFPVPLAGSIDQAKFSAVIEAESLLLAGWPIPPRDNDRLLVDGRWFAVQGIADGRYVGSDLVMFAVQLA